jgi:CheY-like chemotaxis protein
MADAPSQLDRCQKRQLTRFQRMGLSVREMQNGRCLLVSLPLGPAPMESLSGPLTPQRVIFSTVGANQIKCLQPRALFGLPLINIRRCADATSVEWAIRQAWRDRTRKLRDSFKQLHRLGMKVEAVEEGSTLAFPLPGQPTGARVRMQRLGEAILPGAGALNGLPLKDLEERVLEVSDCLDSSSNLERRLDQRIDELGKKCRQRQKNDRRLGHSRKPSKHGSKTRRKRVVVDRQPKVLIVGPRLIDNATLRAELERQGYHTATSQSESDALISLAGMSPDIVISQYELGRSDGASLVQGVHGLPGIDRLPVVLLDEASHEARREVARAVGAAGYLVEPVTAEPFVKRLGRLVASPSDRRFKRYNQQIPAQILGASQPCLVTDVSRGGIFISTRQTAEANTTMPCELVLGEFGKSLRFEGKVVHRDTPTGGPRQGLGLCIFDISSEDEATLIEYLSWLESRT